MSIVEKNGLKVNSILFEFINNEVLPGTDINLDEFWSKFEKAVHELAPINKKLLNKRDEIQKKIDNWHKLNAGKKIDQEEYRKFLNSIEYIVKELEDFAIDTANVDEEIATIAGPQLVVPVDNARYALNAANARWGSLYDALYGTDVIPGKKGKNYDPVRGNKVIAYVRDFLDSSAGINDGSWKKVSSVQIIDKELVLIVNDKKNYLKDKSQFIGYVGKKNNPSSVLLKNNNLHIDIIIDPNLSLIHI